MRASIIAAALVSGLGLAGPVAGQGFGIDQPTVGVRIGNIGIDLGRIDLTPASFALLGCDVDPQGGPAVRFLQLGGAGLTLGDRAVFSIRDAEGLPCADVVSELLGAGFAIDDSRLVPLGIADLIVYDLIAAP